MLQNENAMMTLQNANFIELQQKLYVLQTENNKLKNSIKELLSLPSGMYCDAYPEAEAKARKLLMPNVELRGAL